MEKINENLAGFDKIPQVNSNRAAPLKS